MFTNVWKYMYMYMYVHEQCMRQQTRQHNTAQRRLGQPIFSKKNELPLSWDPELIQKHIYTCMSSMYIVYTGYIHVYTCSTFLSYTYMYILFIFSQTLSTQDLVFIVSQIARGMYHLMRRGLTHRDLATRNI